MAGYIRFDKDLVNDPRIGDMADFLSRCFTVELEAETEITDGDRDFSERDHSALWRNALLGAIVRLFVHADTWIDSADILHISVDGLADVLQLPAWIVRDFPTVWIEPVEEGCAVRLPNYCAKNGIDGRDNRKGDKTLQREVWAQQKREQRARKSAELSASVRKTRPPNVRKTRGQKSTTPVPVPVPLPLDRNRDREPTPDSLASAVQAPRESGEEARSEPRPKPTLTLSQMQAMAASLAERGRDRTQIASVLEPYGATPEQIAAWLAPESVA